MKQLMIISTVIVLVLVGCSYQHGGSPSTPNLMNNSTVKVQSSGPRFIPWGSCDMIIARDGSDWDLIPTRTSSATWGYHLNAVKLLEESPGKNCIKITDVHPLPNGDVSVDVSITHPYHDPVYTGFDVRGIILFPSSQYIPDNDLLEQLGYNPTTHWHDRFASYRKGDAELMNPDGYTTIWAPDELSDQRHHYELEEGFPIFEYYPGEFASGEDLGTINGFKRYYSNPNRHMFEAGRTVTRTFVIRPPASGPILASYSVYAHWTEPDNIPVINPATDFPPEANSPMPYEFWIEQLAPLDPDAPNSVNGVNILWHIKSWDIGMENWYVWQKTLLGGGTSSGIDFVEAFDKCPECYIRMGGFSSEIYDIPGAVPGKWPWVFEIKINFEEPIINVLASDYYIAWLDTDALDGQW